MQKPATANQVTCPLCSGHGTLERTSIVARLHDAEFNKNLQSLIDEVTFGAMQSRDEIWLSSAEIQRYKTQKG